MHKDTQTSVSVQPVISNATFSVMEPTKPVFTATGSFSAFSASAFNFRSLRTTSPAQIKYLAKKYRLKLVVTVSFKNVITTVKCRGLFKQQVFPVFRTKHISPQFHLKLWTFKRK